jgi:hypothetical protein
MTTTEARFYQDLHRCREMSSVPVESYLRTPRSMSFLLLNLADGLQGLQLYCLSVNADGSKAS